MNESLRPRMISSLRRISVSIGTIALLLAVIGCVNGDSMRSAHATDTNTESSAIESNVVQTDSVQESPVSVPTVERATLVSAKMPSKQMRPTIITLPSDADLVQQLAKAQGPVLLDFYADWCGPCRKQSLILHDVEGAAAKTQTTIIKINVDQHRDLAKQMSVSGLPTLIMLQNGQVTQRRAGIATKQQLVSWMQ